MAKKNETTTNFNADISKFKAAFQEASRQIKLANSEFKAASSGMEDWNKSADGVTAKLEQLDKVLNAQKTQLKSLNDQYELTVKEHGESSTAAENLRIRINNQQAAINATQSQIKSYNEQLSAMQQESETTLTASEKLRKAIEEQEKELSELKKKYTDIVLEQGEESDSANDLARQIEALSGSLADNRSELSNAEKAADNLEGSLDDTAQAAEESSDGFTVMKGVLADLVSQGIQAAIQGFKDLARNAKEAYDEYHAGMNNVITATGAAGEAADGLMQSYKNAAKSVKGDMSEIGSTLGEVNTRFGYTGEKLEKATEDFVKFANISGTDAVSAVQLVSRAMGDAGISADEYDSVLDSLAIAAQASGISVDKLTENLTKYGAPMRALGFDTKQSIAVFSAWEKAGVNTETAFSGMKKAISNWSEAGKDSREEFKKTLDEIAAAPDIAAATTQAIEVFGAKAGPDLADAIQGGRFEFSEFLDILENADGTVENTYAATQDAFDKIELAAQGLKADTGEQFSQLLSEYQPEIERGIEIVTNALNDGLRVLKNEIIPFVKDSVKWCVDNLPLIEAAIAAIGTALLTFKAVTLVQSAITAFKALAAAIQETGVKQAVLNAIMAANPVGLVIAAVAGLVAAFVVLWNKSDAFRNFWIGLWESIQETLYGFFDAWTAGFQMLSDIFKGFIDSIGDGWNIICEFFVNALKNIYSKWSIAGDFLKSIWTGFIDSIGDGWNIICEFFVNAFENISSRWSIVGDFLKLIWTGFIESIVTGWEMILDFFAGAWDSLKTGAKSAWDFISGVWSVVTGWFNSTVIEPITSYFVNMWNNLKNGASSAWEGIKSVFSVVTEWFRGKFTEAWTAVKAVFSTGGKIFDGIKEGITEAFKSVVNAIIRGINKVVAIPFNAINAVLDKLRYLSIAGVEPFGWLSDISVPEIPELRTGGVLRKGKVGLLEGDGDEAVVPLEKNTGWLDEVAARISDRIGGSNQYNSSVENHSVTNNFYQTNNSPKSLSRLEIYRQSKNLLKLLPQEG